MPVLQHVSLPIVPGGQDSGRAFYGDLLGLIEKTAPSSRADQGFVWFEAGPGSLEVHLIPDPDGLTHGARRHVCFAVDDVCTVRAALEQAGVATEDAPEIRNRPRFYCQDPFGNRLEIVTIEGEYA